MFESKIESEIVLRVPPILIAPPFSDVEFWMKSVLSRDALVLSKLKTVPFLVFVLLVKTESDKSNTVV